MRHASLGAPQPLCCSSGPRQFNGVRATPPPTEESAEDHPIIGVWLLTVDELP